jgi:hypothetical protein
MGAGALQGIIILKQILHALHKDANFMRPVSLFKAWQFLPPH